MGRVSVRLSVLVGPVIMGSIRLDLDDEVNARFILHAASRVMKLRQELATSKGLVMRAIFCSHIRAALEREAEADSVSVVSIPRDDT